MNKLFKILAVINVVCLMLVIFSSAAFAYQLLEPLPVGTSGEITGVDLGPAPGFVGPPSPVGVVTFSDYAAWFFRFALAAAAFMAVVQITIAGVQFVIGGAMESARKSAKDRIWDAIWGLLLAFGSWLILYTINPNLASMDFSIPAVQTVAIEAGKYDWRPVVGGISSDENCQTSSPSFDKSVQKAKCQIKLGSPSGDLSQFDCCYKAPDALSIAGPIPPAPDGSYEWNTDCSSLGDQWKQAQHLMWCAQKLPNGPLNNLQKCCMKPTIPDGDYGWSAVIQGNAPGSCLIYNGGSPVPDNHCEAKGKPKPQGSSFSQVCCYKP